MTKTKKKIDIKPVDKRSYWIANEYLGWLCELIQADSSGENDDSYRFLARELWRKEFTIILERDQSRAGDGYDLRFEFRKEKDISEEDEEYIRLLSWPVSCLEVLIGIARRYDFLVPKERMDCDRSTEWFWMMVGNLGLDEFSDGNWYDKKGNDNTEKIHKLLDIWLDRRFDKKGKGSIFPIRGSVDIRKGYEADRTAGDQRKVEIWYQMHRFYRENKQSL